MRRVYTGENIFEAQLVCDRLNQSGITAAVHGQMLTGAIGELPADTRPSVWIEDGDLYERARQIIAEFERGASEGGDWRCDRCGETNAPAFEVCWHCGEPPR